jgi:hypothetical protein
LIYRSFDEDEERVSPPILLIEENTGGLYSWWGDDFRISPDGELVMVIKSDGIQIYDIGDASLESVISFSPFQTTGDWAWTPDVSWNTQSNSIFYSALQNETELSGNPESSNFEIKFFDLDSQTKLSVIQSVGIFGSPEVSPGYFNVEGELQTYLAYMQALQSADSVTSEYRLNLVDIDGSNQRSLFPDIGLPGLNPQTYEWSPGTEPQIVLLYHGNIWIIDVLSGEAYQLTADGLTTRIDWK